MDEMFNGGDFEICPQGKLLAGFDSNVLSIHLDLPLDRSTGIHRNGCHIHLDSWVNRINRAQHTWHFIGLEINRAQQRKVTRLDRGVSLLQISFNNCELRSHSIVILKGNSLNQYPAHIIVQNYKIVVSTREFLLLQLRLRICNWWQLEMATMSLSDQGYPYRLTSFSWNLFV